MHERIRIATKELTYPILVSRGFDCDAKLSEDVCACGLLLVEVDPPAAWEGSPKLGRKSSSPSLDKESRGDPVSAIVSPGGIGEDRSNGLVKECWKVIYRDRRTPLSCFDFGSIDPLSRA